jgi:hypothetical protein
MKALALAMCVTVSAMAGCALEAPQATGSTATQPTATESTATESTATEDLSVQGLLPQPQPRFGCHAADAACLTVFQCHHAEGTNIGPVDCPSGTTCCVF